MYAALLTAIVTWISANFALPPDYDHPQLKLVPAVEITFLRYQAFTPAQRRDVLTSLADNTGGPHVLRSGGLVRTFSAPRSRGLAAGDRGLSHLHQGDYRPLPGHGIEVAEPVG